MRTLYRSGKRGLPLIAVAFRSWSGPRGLHAGDWRVVRQQPQLTGMTRPAVTLLLSLALGCGGSSPEDWSVTIDTLPSGAVHVLNSEPGRWGRQPPWQLVEVVTIGSRHDSGPATFGDIAGIDVDAFNRVYVLDRMAQEIRIFEVDGSYVRTLGRRGRGPGEFRAVTGLIFHQNRLWVANQGNGRFSVFDTSGTLVAEYPRPFTGAFSAEWQAAFGPGGNLFEVAYLRTPTRTQSRLLVYDLSLKRYRDTLPGARFPRGTPLFTGRRQLIAEGWWVGVQHVYRLWLVTHRGDTLRIIERASEPEALTETERDSARRHEEELQRRVVSGSVNMEIERRPIFHSFAIDELQYLWVLLASGPEDDRSRIDVFNPDGVYLGQVTAPHELDARTEFVVRGGYLYYVTKDDLQVPYVVVARIRGRR